jgi:hypothetical protein
MATRIGLSATLSILALCGCATAIQPTSAPPAVGGAGGLPSGTWVEIYFDTFDRVSAAAGLEALRARSPRAGEREVRVWIGGGLGYPQTLYRLGERRGRVWGEVVRYWPLDDQPSFPGGHTFDELVARRQRGACGPVRRAQKMAVCRVRFTREPDWAGVLARAEAAHLWSLPDESTLPARGITLDGWSVAVELRDSAAYRAYRYSSPQVRTEPEAASALAIARIFRGVDSLARRPDELRVYRGVTDGRYRGAFRPCGGGDPWEFHESLASLASRKGLPPPDTTAGSLHYVAVLGTLEPEWLAQSWGSAYTRVLQVVELVDTRPWTGRECRGRRGR